MEKSYLVTPASRKNGIHISRIPAIIIDASHERLNERNDRVGHYTARTFSDFQNTHHVPAKEKDFFLHELFHFFYFFHNPRNILPSAFLLVYPSRRSRYR